MESDDWQLLGLIIGVGVLLNAIFFGVVFFKARKSPRSMSEVIPVDRTKAAASQQARQGQPRIEEPGVLDDISRRQLLDSSTVRADDDKTATVN